MITCEKYSVSLSVYPSLHPSAHHPPPPPQLRKCVATCAKHSVSLFIYLRDLGCKYSLTWAFKFFYKPSSFYFQAKENRGHEERFDVMFHGHYCYVPPVLLWASSSTSLILSYLIRKLGIIRTPMWLRRLRIQWEKSILIVRVRIIVAPSKLKFLSNFEVLFCFVLFWFFSFHL